MKNEYEILFRYQRARANVCLFWHKYYLAWLTLSWDNGEATNKVPPNEQLLFLSNNKVSLDKMEIWQPFTKLMETKLDLLYLKVSSFPLINSPHMIRTFLFSTDISIHSENLIKRETIIIQLSLLEIDMIKLLYDWAY